MISRIPFNAVQQNVYQLLSTGQTIPTYDSVPTGPERMPYIVLGEFHGSPLNLNGYTQIGTATISQYQAYQELYADKTSAYHGVLSVEWVLQQELN